MSRYCKTCAHLVRGETYRCGYEATAPWPYNSYKPNHSISPRHVVPGDHYVEVLGSTKDWTEAMDCLTWKGERND